MSDVPLDSWYGVETDSSGRVIEIDLNGNNLDGIIPPELGQLSSLQVLWLYENKLVGVIPVELGQLLNLQKLSLSRNDLSGHIPSELSQLSKLQRLILSENSLNGVIPPELGRLSNLEVLGLVTNGLSGIIPPELGQLSNLQYLLLHENNLSRVIPPELGQLSNLQYLALHTNLLSGTIPSELSRLSNLEGLWLHENNLSGVIPPELGELSNLQNLVLAENGLTGVIPPELGQLSKLQGLLLYENNLSGVIPPELGQLSNLQRLALAENDLSGMIPSELGQLSNLDSIWLHENNLSGVIPPELEQLSKLEVLWLYNDNLSGCIPQGLWNVPDNDLTSVSRNGCVPTPTPMPTPGPGSRQAPLPFGIPAEIRNDADDHWQITVLHTVPNATQMVLDEDSYNDPPDAGKQYYMARVRVKYLGPGSTRFDSEYRLKAAGDGGVVYTWRENSCGGNLLNYIPHALPDPELFTNGAIEGNVCWQINSADAASLLMFIEEEGRRPDSSKRVWFALSGGARVLVTPTPTPTPGPISTPADLVERVKDGVVKVEASTGSFFVFSSTGSGFIFDVEGDYGFVATNYHVVEGADSLEVTVRNTQTYDALVLGWDAERDVAVLAICCSDDFPTLSWEEASPAVGAQVVAIGYPDGGSTNRVTATTGEVVEGDSLSEQHGYIRHTAPLNPGNSGGPLFSMPDAKVLGINTSRDTQTLSFYAVPLQAIAGQITEWRKQLVVSP